MDEKLRGILKTYGVPDNAVDLVDKMHQGEIDAHKEALKEMREEKQKVNDKDLFARRTVKFKNLSAKEKMDIHRDDPELYKKLSSKK